MYLVNTKAKGHCAMKVVANAMKVKGKEKRDESEGKRRRGDDSESKGRRGDETEGKGRSQEENEGKRGKAPDGKKSRENEEWKKK